MNEKEILNVLKIIKEPITVNCIEYKYFDEKNYNKLIDVYENCLLFANNLEKINLTVNSLQQENKKLKGSLQTYEILLKANVEENQQLKENQQKLIDYLKEKINITDDFSEELEDEFYIGKTKAYKEILSKIEKE